MGVYCSIVMAEYNDPVRGMVVKFESGPKDKVTWVDPMTFGLERKGIMSKSSFREMQKNGKLEVIGIPY